MKAQRRRFVVEVKRGTSRASFISTDAAADRFSSAEDALFGGKATAAAVQTQNLAATTAPPSTGRVLRDLQEPPPPPLPDLPAPARRGRKPGSKNKPKPVLVAPPEPTTAHAIRPVWADDMGPQDAGKGAMPVRTPEAPAVAPARETVASTDGASQGRRQRLRDRSSILKRYVLGTEPAPGQAGWVRGLRAKRRG